MLIYQSKWYASHTSETPGPSRSCWSIHFNPSLGCRDVHILLIQQNPQSCEIAWFFPTKPHLFWLNLIAYSIINFFGNGGFLLNGVTPKSSIFIGLSIINIKKPSGYWGTPLVGNLQISAFSELRCTTVEGVDKLRSRSVSSVPSWLLGLQWWIYP